MSTGAILEVAAAIALIALGIWQYRRRSGEPNGGYGSQSAVILFVIAAIMLIHGFGGLEYRPLSTEAGQ